MQGALQEFTRISSVGEDAFFALRRYTHTHMLRARQEKQRHRSPELPLRVGFFLKKNSYFFTDFLPAFLNCPSSKLSAELRTETPLAAADPTVANVTVTRLTLVCNSAPGPITMDLTGDLEALKKQTFVIKEGSEYCAKIHFKVNREIVSGLKYVQHTYRTGVKVDKVTFMVGSYGPRPEEYEFITPLEEAPKGMMARGNYRNKSFFTDDDKHDHLTWEWNLAIKKEWTE
uniref:Rho GDP dissociation inhibitor beta n=1 Tax=Podarcis muralis TaxID=64176 RepID=A0A670J147_PODMU